MDKTVKSILLVDDDKNLATVLAEFLSNHGFQLDSAFSKEEMDQYLTTNTPDLILLDIHLPGANGLTICKEVTKDIAIPVIMLTGSQDDIDKVLALEYGASNYLTKPINPQVLLAFIKLSLKKTTTIIASQDVYHFSNYTLNYSTQMLHDKNGEHIPISPAEFSILVIFCQHPNQILSRSKLMDLMQVSEDLFDRSIDTAICRLRKKIENNPKKPQVLKTIRGRGYIFKAQVIKEINSAS